MTDHRPDETQNESVLDREIKAALSVDPSPEFLARVRTRVANEPAPTAWRLPWLLAAAGAAVATIVIAVAVSHSGQRTEAGSVDRAPLSAKVVPEVPVTQPPAVPVEPPRAAASRPGVVVSGFSRTTNAALGSDRKEPEILISAGEARALRRLLAGVSSGRIDVRMLPPEPSQTLAVVQPLDEIAPITIEPLESAAQGEGVRQ